MPLIRATINNGRGEAVNILINPGHVIYYMPSMNNPDVWFLRVVALPGEACTTTGKLNEAGVDAVWTRPGE